MTSHFAVPAGQRDKRATSPAPELLHELPREVVPVADLMASLSPRERQEDPAHVRLLAETESSLDPILVHRPTMSVIDGVHRLRAAIVKGRTEVTVQFFDGSEPDAFVLAVELNIRHGLPLTLRERKAAAQRIVGSHPDWSDRAIAQRTGLSAKTVGKVRGQASAGSARPVSRIGRDGRARPLSSVDARRSAAAMLLANPGISLRELARKTGVSVGTVRDVRKRIDRGQDPIPEQLRGQQQEASDVSLAKAVTVLPCGGTRPGAAQGTPSALQAAAGHQQGGAKAATVETAAIVRKLARDPSLRATESGRALLRMLVATEMSRSDLEELFKAVPPHCLPLIRVVALKRCEDWQGLAATVPAYENSR